MDSTQTIINAGLLLNRNTENLAHDRNQSIWQDILKQIDHTKLSVYHHYHWIIVPLIEYHYGEIKEEALYALGTPEGPALLDSMPRYETHKQREEEEENSDMTRIVDPRLPYPSSRFLYQSPSFCAIKKPGKKSP